MNEVLFPQTHGWIRLRRSIAGMKIKEVLALYSGKPGTSGNFTHIVLDNCVYRVVKLKQEIKAK